MHARFFPQGDHSLLSRELARMGHQAPGDMLHLHNRLLACKCLGVPHEIAACLTQCLPTQSPDCWCYSTPGATAATVDLLIGVSMERFAALRHDLPQTPRLQPLLTVIDAAWQRYCEAPADLWLGDTAMPVRQRPAVMGILNVTPDSFFDGGFYVQTENALKHTEEMLAQGADLIDVGGASSRPGATPVPAATERDRVVPVVREIVKRFNARVSVDTYRADVAAAALDAGALMINDISALRFDPGMVEVIAQRRAAVVLMHMQGVPQTMQQAPWYRQVTDEVYTFLAERLDHAEQHGIARQRIVCDPGFGFGKTVQHNLELLHDLPHFQGLGQPILVGISRKSFLGHLLQRDVWDRLEGTLASVVFAVLHGAAIVRVHDVAPTVQALRLLEAIRSQQPPARA